MGMVGSAADVAKSRDMAREAIVMLKNGDGLVIPKCCRLKEDASDSGIADSLDWLCNTGAVECKAGWQSMTAAEKKSHFSDLIVVWFEQAPYERSRCWFGGIAEAYVCGIAENKNAVLPLNSTAGKVLVVGPTAHSIGALSAGWSIHWQGVNDDSQFAHGSTILQGIQQVYHTTNVEYRQGCKFGGSSHASQNCIAEDLQETATTAASADVIVVCLGEEPYTEKPGDIDDLRIHSGQIELITELNKAGKPMVLVLVAGRPRLLEGINRLSNVHAVIHALVPGPEGGLAVAEVLFGKVNPSGRLPLTYPSSMSTHYPHWRAVSSQCAGSQVFLSATTQSCPVEFYFGQGLSYSTFSYTGLRWFTGAHFSGTQEATMKIGSAFTVEFTVENTGTMDANHSVLLYFVQAYRSITPEANKLLGFDKVFVAAGQKQLVRFSLHTKDFAYIGVAMDRVVETGKYTLVLGDSQFGVAPNVNDDCTRDGQCLGLTLEHGSCPQGAMPSRCTVPMTPGQAAAATAEDVATDVAAAAAAPAQKFSNIAAPNRQPNRQPPQTQSGLENSSSDDAFPVYAYAIVGVGVAAILGVAVVVWKRRSAGAGVNSGVELRESLVSQDGYRAHSAV